MLSGCAFIGVVFGSYVDAAACHQNISRRFCVWEIAGYHANGFHRYFAVFFVFFFIF